MAINNFLHLLFIVTCSSLLFQIHAAESVDLEKEINRIKKELISVSSQRQSVRQEAVNDLKDQASYKKRFENRLNAATNETDSISELIQVNRQRSDSLSAVINSLITSQKQSDLLQDNFRLRLIAACNQIGMQASKVPPMSSKSITIPATFLQSELAARSIDNIDGMQRLIQILNNHEELTSSIQIFQGNSPLPDMPGTVYRLRIGCLFEAAVQSNGNKYAIWSGVDSTGKEIWLVKNDPDGAAQVLNAINIREGKTLPAFAKVPLFGAAEGEK